MIKSFYIFLRSNITLSGFYESPRCPQTWQLFCDRTLLTDRESMPTQPQTIALYLGHLAVDGKAITTIEQARAAEGIPKADNPPCHPVVAETLKGWRNQAAAPKQADALTNDAWPGSAKLPAFRGAAAVDTQRQPPWHRPEAQSTWPSSE